MGSENLNLRQDLSTDNQNWFNDIKKVLSGDFDPRNTPGVPTGGLSSLGTSAFNWLNSYLTTMKFKSGSNHVTLQAPTLGANILLKLFGALPSTDQFVRVNSSGELITDPINFAISSSCGVFTRSSPSTTDITNLSVSLTTTGYPILVGLIADGTTNVSTIYWDDSSNNQRGPHIFLKRNGTSFTEAGFDMGNNVERCFPTMTVLDAQSAGTYTYQATMLANGPNNTIQYCRLFAIELKS